MRINNGGNVGIGTTNPTALLTLASNETSSLYLTGTSGNSIGIKIQNNNYAQGSYWIIANDSLGGLSFNRNGSDIFFMGRNGNNDVYSAIPIHAPAFVAPARTYADYVFKKDYNLPSLAEVEEHINAKGHLPGVPSEKEAMANGVNVVDMQVTLLAQIEQLTLHAITQEKRLQAQERRLAELEAATSKER